MTTALYLPNAVIVGTNMTSGWMNAAQHVLV
jgi:hypothetical protein